MGSIPGLGTKTPHAVCHGQGNMKEKGGDDLTFFGSKITADGT